MKEDEQLIDLYRIHGSKWALIARIMQNRSSYQVKNRFYGKLRNELGNAGF